MDASDEYHDERKDFSTPLPLFPFSCYRREQNVVSVKQENTAKLDTGNKEAISALFLSCATRLKNIKGQRQDTIPDCTFLFDM